MDSTFVGTPTYTDTNGYQVVSQGCFADNVTARTLPNQPSMVITGNMTVNACGLACSASGYRESDDIPLIKESLIQAQGCLALNMDHRFGDPTGSLFDNLISL